MTTKDQDILIVGAGPTGLTAALQLARQGIKPRIIDKRPHPITTSNALGLQPRTLELFEEMQIVEDVLNLGHRVKGINITTTNNSLAEVLTTGLPTKYPFILTLPQAKTEQLLTEQLKKHGIFIERETSLEGLIQDESYIEATCSGKTQPYAWVIGCDGASSTARELEKIPFQGKNLSQHFIMADIHVDWSRSSDLIQIVISKNGPMAFFPLDNSGFGRLVIDVTGNAKFQNKAEPSLKDFQALLSARLASQATLSDPKWISTFWIQSRIAASYRKGRLFLAGDAAHRHSPFGGQGLNTGVQDAYFLANLLASGNVEPYEKIRHPIGKQIVHRTEMMTRVMTSRSSFVQSIRNFLIPRLLSFSSLRHKVLMTLTELIYK